MIARVFVILLAVCLAVVAPVLAAAPLPVSAGAVLVKSGDALIWSHQADKRLPPASLTKVMTALVVLERADLDEVVTVSAAAAAELGSRLQMQAGDRLRLGDLLAAVLIRSANDGAHALAEHVAGSQAEFVRLMNQHAAELGLADTRFQNASGWDHPQHYSTALDLARLTEYAMGHEEFRRLVAVEEMQVRSLDGESSWEIRNSNRLLGFYEGLQGVKTGFTNRAGPCLISMAERDGKQVLVVLLNSPKRWDETPAILDWVFGLDAADVEGERVAAVDLEASEGRAVGAGGD
ncbi:D-alanyl-D-alanine carboxypeptidase family protein [Geoalkalibacter halelectricus]|uniref:D-alanyl-D-alanine carboxypeptidase n=1 Tax=Geoalkalibacter halelectricus TaxID=2847045 RepID=A0ABY5ZH58_9BACT|nr:D-alanyl-D-alanine carboxypeptidase family protein [Geoalkalibacter halelectricus]MDO3376634.1 D-alanyl-D-alanine carboxypeptidase [Geoalkalibacter halelectricus]UWZ78408.1 D-alanyl-D-alanine carboxypeptidase [Geoalkalibacter halelectricus]